MKNKRKWELLIDLKDSGAKKGMIFEWDTQENCYTTKEMPWFLTPLIPFNYITNKKLFKKL